MGAIIRTAAENKKEADIVKDVVYLEKKWEHIVEEFKKCGEEPKLLYISPTFVEKIILDMPENKIHKIEVNNKKDYNYALAKETYSPRPITIWSSTRKSMN